MLLPSNPMPRLNVFSSTWLAGIVACCQVPGTSTNLKSTILTPRSLMYATTSCTVISLPAIASPPCPARDCAVPVKTKTPSEGYPQRASRPAVPLSTVLYIPRGPGPVNRKFPLISGLPRLHSLDQADHMPLGVREHRDAWAVRYVHRVRDLAAAEALDFLQRRVEVVDGDVERDVSRAAAHGRADSPVDPGRAARLHHRVLRHHRLDRPTERVLVKVLQRLRILAHHFEVHDRVWHTRYLSSVCSIRSVSACRAARAASQSCRCDCSREGSVGRPHLMMPIRLPSGSVNTAKVTMSGMCVGGTAVLPPISATLLRTASRFGTRT